MWSALTTTTYKSYFSLALIYTPSTCLIQIGNRDYFYITATSDYFLAQQFVSTNIASEGFYWRENSNSKNVLRLLKVLLP